MMDFDAEAIPGLLKALDGELEQRGVTADIYLVGGAAMALSFDSTRTTRDIDAVFAPTAEVRAAVEAVAEVRGLPADWLNDAVKGFVPPIRDARQWVVFESPHLRVCVAGLEHLLAMKVAASRVEQDREDLTTLITTLGLTSVDECLAMARETLGPSYPIPARAQYLLTEVFEESANQEN
jgi:hypothetical protein